MKLPFKRPFKYWTLIARLRHEKYIYTDEGHGIRQMLENLEKIDIVVAEHGCWSGEKMYRLK